MQDPDAADPNAAADPAPFPDDDWYGEDAATFGDRVAAAREALGLSQSELAARLGLRVKTLRAWENDMSEPRANRLQMLSGILNVSMRWLLTGVGDGVDGPQTDAALGRDIADILTEMRQVRTEMGHMTERLARLEKRLRGMAAGE